MKQVKKIKIKIVDTVILYVIMILFKALMRRVKGALYSKRADGAGNSADIPLENYLGVAPIKPVDYVIIFKLSGFMAIRVDPRENYSRPF